jgi:hypothetical protein
MTSGVVSCGFGSAVLELFPQIEVNQDRSIPEVYVLQREGRMLKVVLDPLCLGSRYPLWEGSAALNVILPRPPWKLMGLISMFSLTAFIIV